jgi:Cys-tRNA(Pro)/Cys-tRNA(Cys) deacylase
LAPVAKNSKSAGAGTPATVALARAKVPYSTHAYEHDPAAPSYGTEAAEAMGVEPGRVFKTLVAEVDGRLTVAVVADPAAAERSSGYVLGGISPLGQRRPLRTVVDDSALGYPTMFCSAGRRGLEVELAPADLVRLTSAVTAPISRG